MTTLVIPDIHQNIEFANKILTLESPHCDEIVFLGDYFDSFFDPPKVASFRNTCKWLKEIIHNKIKPIVFLLGNHDLSYIYNNNKKGYSSVTKTPDYYCSGVTKSKISDFRKEFFDYGLKDEYFFEHFKLAYMSNGFIFSHGGIIPQHFPYGCSSENFVTEVCPKAFQEFRSFGAFNYLIRDVGVCRHGNAPFGGILWCDWRFDFYPSIDIGYNQVCGHTTLLEPNLIETIEDPDSKIKYENWCIDCKQKYYAVIKNGKLNIETIS